MGIAVEYGNGLLYVSAGTIDWIDIGIASRMVCNAWWEDFPERVE